MVHDMFNRPAPTEPQRPRQPIAIPGEVARHLSHRYKGLQRSRAHTTSTTPVAVPDTHSTVSRGTLHERALKREPSLHTYYQLR